MAANILLAVDGSACSNRAVEYTGDVLCGCQDVTLTLYHVIEIPPMLLEAGGTEASQAELQAEREEWEAQKRGEVEREIFAPARRILREKGVREDVNTIQSRIAEDAHPDVALTIIKQAEEGNYDTVVLGKRGVSMLKEFMYGSVASKVVHHIQGHTIWIVE